MLALRGRHRSDPTLLGTQFNILWIGQAVSLLGDYLAFFSVPLLVAFVGTRSSDLGVWYALDTLPTLLFGFLSGVVIDRVKIRSLMIVADLARAAIFFILAGMVGGAPIEDSGAGLPLLFAAAFGLGTFSTVFSNALHTIVPSLVSKERLGLANGRLAWTQSAAFTVGPMMAGLLVASVGFWITFVINGITFLVSAVSLVILGPVARPEPAGASAGITQDILSGIRFLWNEARLRTATVAVALTHLVLGFLEGTFVLAATEVVGAQGERQISLLYVAFGLGAVAGGVLAPRLAKLIGLGKTMTAGLVILGLCYTVFVNSSYSLLGSLYLFTAFVGLQMIQVPVFTIRQAYTPPILLGRVISASRAVAWATLPLGALVGTAISDATGRFDLVSRIAPLLILATGLALIPTIIWRDSFGPAAGRRAAPMGAPAKVEI